MPPTAKGIKMGTAVIMPDMGENIDHGIVSRVEVAEGDEVKIGHTLIEVESDKVILEVPAELDGIIMTLSVKEGDAIKPGEQIALIACQDSVITSELKPKKDTSDSFEAISLNKALVTIQKPEQLHGNYSLRDVYAGPAAHRLARELGVPLALVPGTGVQGRISVDDIKAFVRTTQPKKKSQNILSLPDFSDVSSVSREPLTGIARTTARNMTHVWDKVPHAWLQIKVDVTQIESIKKRQNSLIDVVHRLSLTVYLLKMLALTLKQFPNFNACYDEENEELILKKDIHLGLAVDTPRGLLVPVIKHVDLLSLNQLSSQLNELVNAGKANQLAPDQLRGSGMTLSNLGGMGINSLFPLINWPEVAILGSGTITLEPVWQEDQFVPCSILTLVLGFDHRVINGADAARFLNYFKKILENPYVAALS